MQNRNFRHHPKVIKKDEITVADLRSSQKSSIFTVASRPQKGQIDTPTPSVRDSHPHSPLIMGILIVLILLGILLLVVELVLLPGISVAGIGALLSLIAAATYGFLTYGLFGGSITVAIIAILAIAAVVISLRANTWRRLSLNATVDSTSTPTPQQQHVSIGTIGTALTRLAPMGKVQIDTLIIEAKAMDGYIDPKVAVEVIGFDNTSVVVRKAVNATPATPATMEAPEP